MRADKTGVRGPAGHQYPSAHDHAHLPHHRLPRDHQLPPGDQGGGQPHRDPGPGHGAPRRGGSGQPRHRVQRLVCVPAHPQPPRCELFVYICVCYADIQRFVCRSTSSTAALSSPSTTTPPAPTPRWLWTCASPPSSWPRSIPDTDNCCLIFLFYTIFY